MLISMMDREIDRLLQKYGCIRIKVTEVYETTICGYCNESFITILNRDKRALPVSIVVNGEISGKKYWPGDYITISRKHCDDFIVMDSTNIADLVMPAVESHGSVEEKYKNIRDFLGAREVSRFGMLPITARIEMFEDDKPFTNNDASMKTYITEQVSLLLEELKENRSITANNIIGYGAGLTPSADDFLLGVLSALDHYGELDRRIILSEYIKKYSSKTTEVSSWMLRYGAEQSLYPHIVIDYFTSIGDEGDFLHEFLKHGSSSGIDLLCGMLCGLNILRKGE